jgi:hypothetical protein
MALVLAGGTMKPWPKEASSMAYLKGILGGLAAIIIAEFVPGRWSVFRILNGSKATGMSAFIALLVESFFSPLFWVLAVFLFAVLFTASRLDNRVLRVAFFWIPSLTASCVGVTIASFFAYLVIRFRNP